MLHLVDQVTARASTAVGLTVVIAAFLVVAAVVGYPESWLRAFHVIAAGVTLAMVFVIQHAQTREQAATQRKLDELVRALPQADDHLVQIEAASDEELSEREHRDRAHHGAIREGP